MSDSQNTISAAPESQSPAVSPRYHVPDDWSGKGACPVCRTRGQLRVQHQDVAPDRIVCGACGAAFEVASAGARIRLAAVPAALAAKTAELVDVWLTPAELLVLVERATSSGPSSPLQQPAATESVSELPLAPSLAPPTSAVVPPVSADTNIAEGSLTAAPAAPRSSMPANGHAAEPDDVPGSEDWFATLAAAIGGLLPAKPPPDSVLADELERALTSKPEPSRNIAAELAPGAMAAGASDVAALVAPGTPNATSMPPAAPETLNAGAEKLADPSSELIGQAAPGIPAATARPEVAAAEMAAAGMPAPIRAGPILAAPNLPEPNIAPPSVIASGTASAAAPAAPPGAKAAALVPAGNAVAIAAEAAISLPARAGTASRRELAERAWKLHELGNSLPSIQSALESSGGSPDDVNIIMAKLIALEQARQARFRRNVQWAAGGSILGLVILLAIAALISSLTTRLSPAATSGPRVTAAGSVSPGAGTPSPGTTAQNGTPVPGQSEPTGTLAYNPIIAFINEVLPGDVKLANGPSPTPAATSEIFGGMFPATPTFSPADLATGDAKRSKLPSWVATLVPSSITVINVPTPSIDPNGPPVSPCPTTSDQASALFGGPAASWNFNRQQQGWIFILADKPTTIRVPGNMTAGYLVVGDKLEMRFTPGPVTIHNVYFVTVSCL